MPPSDSRQGIQVDTLLFFPFLFSLLSCRCIGMNHFGLYHDNIYNHIYSFTRHFLLYIYLCSTFT